jgi:two-component system chemotaxis response regulator CheY
MPKPRDIRILLVDDNQRTVAILHAILRELGFPSVDEADSAEAALLKIRGNDYDLVFCDWHMAKMSGLDLLRIVRAEARTEALPFILVTAETGNLHVREALEAGASSYLLKPFTVESLRRVLAAV